MTVELLPNVAVDAQLVELAPHVAQGVAGVAGEALGVDGGLLLRSKVEYLVLVDGLGGPAHLLGQAVELAAKRLGALRAEHSAALRSDVAVAGDAGLYLECPRLGRRIAVRRELVLGETVRLLREHRSAVDHGVEAGFDQLERHGEIRHQVVDVDAPLSALGDAAGEVLHDVRRGLTESVAFVGAHRRHPLGSRSPSLLGLLYARRRPVKGA